MADPICRWRNSSIKQIMEFNTLFPLCKTNKKVARELVEKRWNILGGADFFTTPYQLAAQMGVYYEDYQNMYPKFSKYISLEEAQQYMRNWGKKYYAPNPYTKSLQQTEKPIIINNFLVNWCLENEEARFSEALRAMFVESIGNTDILVNMLNNFSEVSIANDIMTLKENAPETPYDTVFLEIDKNDKKYFFDFVTLGFNSDFINVVKDLEKDLPLQTIFYGAPGTGKSHKVKEVTDTLPKSDVFRTTFHPDSDYSTFVGCYKPKMVKAPIRDGSGHEITSACEDEKKRIAYEYEPQAFLKAYVRAYETNEPVFLVIEEINRGNCAQIFGDMFQLLDRNENGESDYAIKPETAIQEFLNEKLKDCEIEDEAIKSGEEMRLPANLHIWATMNTSDQSLFPIDSAFKRRWDWKYMPINTRKESWSIKVNGTEYSWSDFLEKINAEIDVVTHSEDKKLGFYFCKAENGVISAEKFVSKVLFYIYNDVFKDYGFDKDIFNDTDGKLSFGKFYQENGDIQEDKVAMFLKNLGVGELTSISEKPVDVKVENAENN